MSHDVVVVGAGVIGAAIACHLARAGASVALVDRSAEGVTEPSATWASAGGLRAQGRSAAEREISVAAARRWPGLAEELGAPVGFRQGGHLHLAETDMEAEAIAERVRADRAGGVDIVLLDAPAIAAIAPGVTPRAVAAAWTPGDGQAHPGLSARAFAAAAARAGARLRLGEPVRLARAGAGRIVAATPGGPIPAGTVVLAAGAWSIGLLAGLGIALPLRWRGLQMLLSDVAPPALGPTITAAGRNLSLKQTAGGQYMIGGRWMTEPPADGTVRAATDAGRAALQWSGAAAVWPPLAACRLAQIWAGAEAQTPDAVPLIGPVCPDGPFLATGFSGHGFQIAPEIGRLVALALSSAPQPLLAPFDPARFASVPAAERAAFIAAA